MANIIKTIAQPEYGIEIIVAQIKQGFSITVRDTDADDYVPCHIIYPTAEAAIAKAMTM